MASQATLAPAIRNKRAVDMQSGQKKGLERVHDNSRQWLDSCGFPTQTADHNDIREVGVAGARQSLPNWTDDASEIP